MVEGTCDLVALRLPPGPAFVAALRRAWDAGDAVLPLAPAQPEPELRTLLRELRPARLVDPTGETRLAGAAPVERGVALVVATSGSTGAPKGVELTHAALQASARASVARLSATTTHPAAGGVHHPAAGAPDRWLLCLPLHHVAGIQVLSRAWLADTQAVVHPRFDPQLVAAEPDVTMVALVPTMLGRLLDAGVDVARFRAVLLGGAHAPSSLLERAHQAGATVVTTYGMTETCGGCVYDGVPLDGVEVRLDAQRRIELRGPVLARGYRGGTPLPGDGWLRTNDLGRFDASGRLEVLGRADDVIITGGENVSGAEIGALLRTHPGVCDAVVFGEPDPDWGQRIVAAVVPADPGTPPTLETLRRFVTRRAALPKAPRRLVVVDRLPRTALGKVAVAALRKIPHVP